MKKEDIVQRIQQGLKQADLLAEEIRVLPDPYSGYRIAVVSSGFEGKSREERKRVALGEVPNIEIQWLDLLTPAERDWAGALPADINPEQLPLWPESLARAKFDSGDAVFPSDLDEDLTLPIVATFYSLRGGVGRSTALAYTAHILAERGKKVVCVDLDLEAPGLASLFGKEDEVGKDRGVVELLLALDQHETPDVSRHLIRISENYDLYCLPAGIPNADYARKLSLLDPEAWYREEQNPLRDLLEMLATKLPFKPDVVLLDSRTGITRLSGPLLFDLADLTFIVFFPHPQAKTGTEELVRALLASRTRRSSDERPLAPEPRFIVSPVPSSKLPEIVQRYKHRAAEWIHDWIAGKGGDSDRWNEKDITHFIPYQDAVATSDRVFDDPEVWKNYQAVAEWVLKFLPTADEQQTPPRVADVKSVVLEELTFPTGTAEHQENLLTTFVYTERVSRALRPEVPLVLGRKGAGKTAIFRRLAESKDLPAVQVLAPAKLRTPWQLSAAGFKDAEEILQRNKAEWWEFWVTYVCLACHIQWPDIRSAENLVPEALRGAIASRPATEGELLDVTEKILATNRWLLRVSEWLAKLDDATSAGRILLFDGLDTGFGSAKLDRERRTRALEGLFTLYTDRGEGLKNLRFKIVLREDIWRKLRFENKSHLHGRSVRLAWDKQPDYLRVAIRQALLLPKFKKLVELSGDADGGLDDEAVYRAWNVLVGERMKGGNTTYTANWVWNRLADANNDRGPRALLQLFYSATQWERDEHRRNPYEKSILRPRALTESLDAVSVEAVSALMEEFPELDDLRQKLMALGRTPLQADELVGLDDEVALAREVGLLSVYEGTENDPSRYRVPDLYRIGLGMTRMGQL
ncbi:P-loop ATPase, Sll1717 family [Sorangium sp. So ce513]|uniref:P-loop ATPase, Sll1717 family n=1 Tax=Sorangium sp. So ce513 TaxID=3133315 RepID=UPI003F636D02